MLVKVNIDKSKAQIRQVCSQTRTLYKKKYLKCVLNFVARSLTNKQRKTVGYIKHTMKPNLIRR